MLSENPIQKSSTSSNKLIQSERIIGIDIVKIVAMFSVTLLHITGIGGAIDAAENPLTNFLLCSLNGVSFCCINLFALTTGFLYYNRKTHCSRLIELWIQVVFWSVFANIIPAVYFKDFSFLIKSPLYRIFVISFSTYWYIDAYFALFLFIPLLNAAIEKLNQKQFIVSLTAASVLFGIIPFLFDNKEIIRLFSGNSFMWIAYLYLIGAGIKKYNLINRVKNSVLITAIIISSAIQIVTTYICRNLNTTFYDIDYSKVYGNYNFIVVFILSISLFMLISKINTKSLKLKKIIILLSTVSLSVYLIQCNHAVWNNLIVDQFGFIGKNSPISAVISAIGVSMALYIGFTVLGILQNKLFKICKIKNLCNSIENIAKKVFDLFYSKFLSKCVKN